MFFCSDVSVKYDEANVTAEFRFHGDKEYTVEMRIVEGALYYTLSWPPHAGLLTKVFWFCCSTMQLFCLICTVRVWIFTSTVRVWIFTSTTHLFKTLYIVCFLIYICVHIKAKQ